MKHARRPLCVPGVSGLTVRMPVGCTQDFVIRWCREQGWRVDVLLVTAPYALTDAMVNGHGTPFQEWLVNIEAPKEQS